MLMYCFQRFENLERLALSMIQMLTCLSNDYLRTENRVNVMKAVSGEKNAKEA